MSNSTYISTRCCKSQIRIIPTLISTYSWSFFIFSYNLSTKLFCKYFSSLNRRFRSFTTFTFSNNLHILHFPCTYIRSSTYIFESKLNIFTNIASKVNITRRNKFPILISSISWYSSLSPIRSSTFLHPYSQLFCRITTEFMSMFKCQWSFGRFCQIYNRRYQPAFWCFFFCCRDISTSFHIFAGSSASLRCIRLPFPDFAYFSRTCFIFNSKCTFIWSKWFFKECNSANRRRRLISPFTNNSAIFQYRSCNFFQSR